MMIKKGPAGSLQRGPFFFDFGLLVDGVLGRVGGRTKVFPGTANRVAGRDCQSTANQQGSQQFTHHDHSSMHWWNDNGANYMALSTVLAAEFTSFAAPRTVLHAA